MNDFVSNCIELYRIVSNIDAVLHQSTLSIISIIIWYLVLKIQIIPDDKNALTCLPLDRPSSPRVANPLISIEPLAGRPQAALSTGPTALPDALATRCSSAISMPQRTDGRRLDSRTSSPAFDVDDGLS